MHTPQIVRLERRQCSAQTPDGPCQRKAEATVLFDRTGKRIILSTRGAATGQCLSHCHDQIAIGEAHDARVSAGARLRRDRRRRTRPAHDARVDARHKRESSAQ